MTQSIFQVMKAIQHHALPQNTTLQPSLRKKNAVNELLIIQRDELVDGTQPPPHCTPDTQSLGSSSMADKTFADLSGWAQGPAYGLLYSKCLGLHPIELCCQLISIPEPTESPTLSDSNQLSTSTTHPLPEISTIEQDLQSSTLNAHLQDNANITDCLLCSKPYGQVIDKTAAD